DNMANLGRISDQYFNANHSLAPNTLYIPRWNNTTIETPIRRFIRDLNQTAHQADWLINRPIRDYQLYRDNTHNSLIGFTNIATCRNLRCLNWIQHNTWTFHTKIINDLTLTIDLRHSRDPDYFKDLKCFFCNNIQELLEHLVSC